MLCASRLRHSVISAVICLKCCNVYDVCIICLLIFAGMFRAVILGTRGRDLLFVYYFIYAST